MKYVGLNSLVVDRVPASSAGGLGFKPQSRTASYQRRYKNGTSSALNIQKGKYWLFLKK